MPRRATSKYRIKGGTTQVSLRHHEHGHQAGSGDAWTLYEVFRSVDYRFPNFVADVLPPRADRLSLVDIGANLGFFSLFTLARYPNARITAFEPDPENAALLRQNLRDNDALDNAHVIEACAYTRDGSLNFVGGQGSMSHVSINEPGATVSAVDVFPYLEDADLIKLDIEGGEWPLLADSRFAQVSAPVIALEYHSVACPGENARHEATARLRKAGYEIHHPQPDRFPPSGPVWGASVLWAYRD